MNKLGLGVHLLNFDGNVTIKNNNFSDTQLLFSETCDSEWTNIDRFYTPNQSPKYENLVSEQNDAYQLQSLIVIENLEKDRAVQITENKFEGNSMGGSLISISQQN